MKTAIRQICLSLIVAVAASALLAAEEPAGAVLDSVIREQTLPSPPKPKGRPSVAVVLSGGGAKGFAHVSVLELLEEEHIPVDMIIGVSAGSIVASLYATGHSPAEILTAMRKFGAGSNYTDRPVSPFENILGDRSTGTTPLTLPFKIGSRENIYSLAGLISGQRAYELFKSLTLRIPSDVNYDTLPVPLRTVSTNLLTGKPDIRSSGDIAEGVRSSVSMPTVFQPFSVDGNYYIDGGTLDNTPIDVAVKMGYDIIIVSDISEHIKQDPAKFQSSLLMPLAQWTSMDQSLRVEHNKQFATLYITPDTAGAGTLSFTKTEQIYTASKKSLEQYRQTLKDLYNKDFAGITAADGRTVAYHAVYGDNPHLRVTHLEVTGALDNDEYYISREFEKIKDTELTEDEFEQFSQTIYRAGKYNTVVSRITGTDGDYTLHLLLTPIQPQNGIVLIGGTYAGSLAQSSLSDFSLSADVQWRGLTGYGSLVSAHVSVIDGFSGGVTFRHRFTGGMFVQLDSDYTDSFTTIRPGFTNDASYIYSVKDFSTYLETGYSFLNNTQLVKASAGYRLFDTTDIIEEFGGKSSAAEFGLTYTSNTLDRLCYPHSGFYLQADATGVIPVTYYAQVPFFDKTELDFSGALPLGRHVTVVAGGYAGANISQNLLDVLEIAPIYSFSLANRRFFPQIVEAFSYDTCMGAASAAVCFSPDSMLDILGMKLVLDVSGAVGNSWLDFKSVSGNNLMWRSSFDIGVGISNAFCAILRVGAGSTLKNSVLPFVSFDVGKIML